MGLYGNTRMSPIFILWHCQTGRTVGLNKMVLQGVNELAPIPGSYFQCPLLQGSFLVSESCYFGIPNHGADLPGSSADFLASCFGISKKTFLYFSRVKLGWAVISCYTRGLSEEKSCCKCIKQKHDSVLPLCLSLLSGYFPGRQGAACTFALVPYLPNSPPCRCSNSKPNCHLPPCFFS